MNHVLSRQEGLRNYCNWFCRIPQGLLLDWNPFQTKQTKVILTKKRPAAILERSWNQSKSPHLHRLAQLPLSLPLKSVMKSGC
ncbi:MAG TPA: hypothetical protein VN658_10465, partial [Candidatus Acidoferrales bacterium]|nr:hypothetical protein [Candidatus Acidoferrales bacterium]